MAQQTKPNVVFILVDNLGWGDIGCNGGTAPTPRIDALASQGIRFRNYNVEAQCTPTRSAILTGRLPVTATGVLKTSVGIGRFNLESATVGGVPIPMTIAEQARRHRDQCILHVCKKALR